RPLTFKKLREEAQRSLTPELDRTGLRDHILSETQALEQALAGEGERFDRLFSALQKGEMDRAERIQAELISTETDGAERLRRLRQRVSEEMTALTEAAQAREHSSIQLLFGLSVLTLVVGLVTSIYARRVLKPLTAVTDRARAVA